MSGDYRASIEPDTAQRRLEYFTSLSIALDARHRIDEIAGKKSGILSDDPDEKAIWLGFEDMIRGSIRFAKAQVKAAHKVAP